MKIRVIIISARMRARVRRGEECGPSLDQFSPELKVLHLSGVPRLLPQSPTCNTPVVPSCIRERNEAIIGRGWSERGRLATWGQSKRRLELVFSPSEQWVLGRESGVNTPHRLHIHPSEWDAPWGGERRERLKGKWWKSHTRGQLMLLAGGWFSFQAKLLRGGEKNQHISFFKGITYLKSAVYWNGPPLLLRSPTFWLSRAAALQTHTHTHILLFPAVWECFSSSTSTWFSAQRGDALKSERGRWLSIIMALAGPTHTLTHKTPQSQGPYRCSTAHCRASRALCEDECPVAHEIGLSLRRTSVTCLSNAFTSPSNCTCRCSRANWAGCVTPCYANSNLFKLHLMLMKFLGSGRPLFTGHLRVKLASSGWAKRSLHCITVSCGKRTSLYITALRRNYTRAESF